jgi:hypothetical protein
VKGQIVSGEIAGQTEIQGQTKSADEQHMNELSIGAEFFVR